MKVTIEEVKPHENMEIEVRVVFWDGSRRPHNGADVFVFIPQKDYTLSGLRQTAVEEARKFMEQCLREEWAPRTLDD